MLSQRIAFVNLVLLGLGFENRLEHEIREKIGLMSVRIIVKVILEYCLKCSLLRIGFKVLVLVKG